MKKLKFFGLITFLTLAAAPILSGCSKAVDYVGKTHLETVADYTKNTFLDNGIGEVTLKNTVDGDTAHFYQKEVDPSKNNSKGLGRVVKVRFFGNDTPESTGKIELGGKQASAFTSGKLLEAKTIVLTVDIPNIGKPAEFDSTGTRYIGFVWVSDKENCPREELKLLNLWIVQEGWSNAKSITESPLAQQFIDADMQAQKLKRGIWGELPPLETDVNETDIKTLMDAFELGDEELEAWNGATVGVTGTVYKVVGTDCYLNTWIEDPISHEMQQYGLFVFAGYKNYKPLKALGAVIHVIGYFQVHYGNPQLTNVAYDSLHPGPHNMSIVEEAKEGSINVPTVAVGEVNNNRAAINRIVRLEGLTATGGYDEVDATTLVKSGAMSVYAQDANGDSITFRVPDSVWVVDENDNRVETFEYFMQSGLSFDVTGAIALFESTNGSGKVTFQITLCSKADVVIHVV